jgi:S-methylmethionine-dependent homocysteine/selenocysteine methylase
MIREWLHIGAEIIGGCCKTGSHHIKLIKQVHEEFDEEQRL